MNFYFVLNIPTDFEKDPTIGCRVTGVNEQTDGRTDGRTDRHAMAKCNSLSCMRLHVKIICMFVFSGGGGGGHG